MCIILLMIPAYDVLTKRTAILKACKEVRGPWMLGVNRTRRHMALVHDEGDKITACKHARENRFVLSVYFSCRCHLSARYRDKILVCGGNYFVPWLTTKAIGSNTYEWQSTSFEEYKTHRSHARYKISVILYKIAAHYALLPTREKRLCFSINRRCFYRAAKPWSIQVTVTRSQDAQKNRIDLIAYFELRDDIHAGIRLRYDFTHSYKFATA